MAPTARENGIGRLYHYQPFNEQYLADILGRRRIHCSDPSRLNDPWDCKPWLDPSTLENPDARSALIKSLSPIISVVAGQQTELHDEAIRMLEDSDQVRRILKKLSEGLSAQIRERYGIYCLTPHPDSTLMWSHYAANHRGICLEFGTDSPLFGSAFAIRYSSTYPSWQLPELFGDKSIEVALSKSDAWQLEDEYRIIGVKAPFLPAKSGLQIAIEEDSLVIPPDSLKSIIVGCEAEYEAIAQAVAKYAPRLQLKRAVREPGLYRLQIVPVEQAAAAAP